MLLPAYLQLLALVELILSFGLLPLWRIDGLGGTPSIEVILRRR